MKPEEKARYAARARILKAMAHPTRLFVIDELSRRERCVCELREMVGGDMSTISKHLAVLREAGLVRHERRGNQVFYSLGMPCVTGFFGCIESVLESEARRAIELAELPR